MQKNPLNKGRSMYRALIDFFMKSAILYGLCRFTKALYRTVAQSIFGSILTCFERLSLWFSGSRIAGSLQPKIKTEPKKTLSFKIAKLYDESIFALVLDKIKWALLACQLNVYAIFGITFGFSSALVLILQNYAFRIDAIHWDEVTSLINPLMASLCFVVISVLIVFSKKPLIRAINESRLISFVMFDILRIRRMPASEYEGKAGLSFGAAVVLGLMFGGISYWYDPAEIAAVMCISIMCIIIMHSPEAGITSMLFFLPFMPTMALVMMCSVTILSFIIKCIRRKRIFRMNLLDVCILIFAAFILSGGLISVNIPSSIPKMLVYLCFIMMYFVVKSLVRSQNMLNSCFVGLASSFTIVSAIGILQYVMGNVSPIWLDKDMFADIPGRAVSTFQNPNVLGEYLILVLPLIFAFLLCAKSANQRFFLFISFMLGSCCLLMTWSRGAWLGFCFAVMLFILLKNHEFLAGTLLCSPLLLLAASVIMDKNVLDRILSIGNTADSSTLYRINIWLGSMDMIGDTWTHGIGIGEEAFSSVFPHYAPVGTEVAPHTHSLYLQIISEMGIFALIAFAASVFLYLSINLDHIRRTPVKNSRTLAVGAMCGIIAFLVQGFTDYVWYNYRVYLFFWIMIGISVAIVQINSEEDRRMFTYS